MSFTHVDAAVPPLAGPTFSGSAPASARATPSDVGA
eukprot:COSAG06_NODE_37885_length_430_cov_0.570997_1_plen_35_part_10